MRLAKISWEEQARESAYVQQDRDKQRLALRAAERRLQERILVEDCPSPEHYIMDLPCSNNAPLLGRHDAETEYQVRGMIRLQMMFCTNNSGCFRALAAHPRLLTFAPVIVIRSPHWQRSRFGPQGKHEGCTTPAVATINILGRPVGW